MSMKSNLEYLKEAITNGNRAEALEFLDGVVSDIEKTRKTYEDAYRDIEIQLEASAEHIDPSEMTSFDCGIGTVLVKCDNLALVSKLEDFLATLKHQHTGSSVLY